MAKDPAKALKAGILQSKKVTVNYGFCLGIDPWESSWIIHKTKTPKTLAQQAKKEGNTLKTIYGQMTTELNVISLTSEKALPGRVAWIAKMYLKELKLKYKVRIISPDGNVEESDSDDEEEDDKKTAKASPPRTPVDEKVEEAVAEAAPDEEEDEKSARPSEEVPADPNTAKWAKAHATLLPKVEAAIAADAPRAADIGKLWSALTARADAGDATAALGGVQALVKLLSARPEQPAAEAPQPGKLDPALGTRFKKAAEAMKKAIAGAPDRKAELLALFGPVRDAFGVKDGAALAGLLPDFEAALDLKTGDAPAQAAPVQDPPPDPARIAAELRSIWSKARSTTDGQLQSLQSVIAGDGTPEGQEIAKVGLTGWSAAADRALETALAQLESAPSGKVRLTAARTGDAIATYDTFLKAHPAVEALEQNAHGVPVTLNATLGTALKDMRRLVAAV